MNSLINFVYSVLSYHIKTEIPKYEVTLSSRLQDALRTFIQDEEDVVACMILNHRSRFSIVEEYNRNTFFLEDFKLKRGLGTLANIITSRTSSVEKIRNLSPNKETYDDLINSSDKVAWLVMTIIREASKDNV